MRLEQKKKQEFQIRYHLNPQTVLAFFITHSFLYCIHRKLSFFGSLNIGLGVQYSVNFILVLLLSALKNS